jgi:hypothetical protein
VWDCKVGGVNVTVGLGCESGEELQRDWLELTETPWGEKAYVLVVASALHAIDYVTQPTWRAARLVERAVRGGLGQSFRV